MYKFLISLVCIGNFFSVWSDPDKSHFKKLTTAYVKILKDLALTLPSQISHHTLKNFIQLCDSHIELPHIKGAPLSPEAYLRRLHNLLKQASLNIRPYTSYDPTTSVTSLDYKVSGLKGRSFHHVELTWNNNKLIKIKESITYPSFR